MQTVEVDFDKGSSPIEKRKIVTQTVNGPQEVAAAIYGPLALHLFITDDGLPSDKALSITHVETGLKVISMGSTSQDANVILADAESLIGALQGGGLIWDCIDGDKVPEATTVAARLIIEIFFMSGPEGPV